MKNTFILIMIVFGFSNCCIARPLYHNSIKHKFSSPNKKDQFILTVEGSNIFDSHITFKIVTWNNDTIYNEKFTMGEFMEFGPRETDKAYHRDKNDSLNILVMLSQFFNEERFSDPAIKDTLDNDGNLLPREDWWDIWLDKSSVGFTYQLGAEDGRSIAYSKKKKKVVLYHSCC